MSSNPRKAPSRNLRPQPKSTGPISCAAQEQKPGDNPLSIVGQKPARLTGEVEIVDSSSLTFRQQAALPIVANSPTIAQAARASGVGESTLRRWLSEPAFSDQLAVMRRESAQLARQELNGLLPQCASVFAEAMQGPDPTLRVRAARYALSFILRMGEMERLSEELRSLEAAAQMPKSSQP